MDSYTHTHICSLPTTLLRSINVVNCGTIKANSCNNIVKILYHILICVTSWSWLFNVCLVSVTLLCYTNVAKNVIKLKLVALSI